MTVRFVRPFSVAAYLSRYLGLAALALFLIAAGIHRFGPLTTPDLVGLLIIAAGIALAAVLLALVGLERLWTRGARGGLSALAALLLSALPLGVAGYGAFLYWQQPKIYDISTDLTDVPQWLVTPTANQQWLARPATVAKEDRDAQAIAYASLAGRRYEGAIDRIYTAAKKMAVAPHRPYQGRHWCRGSARNRHSRAGQDDARRRGAGGRPALHRAGAHGAAE